MATSIAVTLNPVNFPTATTSVPAQDPAEWTADDARRFVWDVWGLLQAHGGRELQPYGTWRLEFVADTGSAVTVLPM